MRQYRGLTKEGKWVYGWYCKAIFECLHDNFERHLIIPEGAICYAPMDCSRWPEPFPKRVEGCYEIIPETVGQSTGLKDKNGTDLDWWENDLLRKGPDHSCAPIGIITYNEQKAKWVIISKSGGEFCGLEQAYVNGWTNIGNIHQNPEILERKTTFESTQPNDDPRQYGGESLPSKEDIEAEMEQGK